MNASSLLARKRRMEDGIFWNLQKGISVAFEGELYNRAVLASNLGESASLTDAQLLLKLFERDRESCFNQLDGMFSLAIYDHRREQLYLVRDRAGEKPLFYCANQRDFFFSSDLDDLTSNDSIEKAIDRMSLCQYLQLGYLFAPFTIYHDIWMLEPGHYLLVDANGTISDHTYYEVQCGKKNLIEDYETCRETLRKNLMDAVQDRLESGQPNGVFLSGGIDSTIVAGIASQLLSQRLDTFTIGFFIKEYDESDRAQIAADAFQTQHHLLRLDYADALDKIEHIIHGMGQPFADPSAIPTYIVNEYAKQWVNVVLTGDASDQMMAGSNKYLIHHYVNLYCKVPKFLRKGILEKIILMMPDDNAKTRKIRKVIGSADLDSFGQRRQMMCQVFKEDELSRLLKDNWYDSHSLDAVKELYDRWQDDADELSRTLYTDIRVVVEGGMLAKMGSMSRLAGIETRVPMVSKNMLDWNSRIPSHYKLKGRVGKYILRDAFSDMIPEPLKVASKKGFGVPLDQWFRGPLKQKLLDVLNRETIEAQNIFQYEYIEQILEEHFSRRRNRAGELWALYVFQRWYQNHFSIRS